MTHSNSGRSFFATLPGIFTGLASLIGAVSALYVALHQNPANQPNEAHELVDTPSQPARPAALNVVVPGPPNTIRDNGEDDDPKSSGTGVTKEVSSEPERIPAARPSSPSARTVGGSWQFAEAWDHDTGTCEVGGVYQLEQQGDGFAGTYSQESDCGGSTRGVVSDGAIVGNDVSFVVPSGNVICVYEGVVAGWPAHRMEGSAICGDGLNYVTGEWYAYRETGR